MPLLSTLALESRHKWSNTSSLTSLVGRPTYTSQHWQLRTAADAARIYWLHALADCSTWIPEKMPEFSLTMLLHNVQPVTQHLHTVCNEQTGFFSVTEHSLLEHILKWIIIEIMSEILRKKVNDFVT